MSARLLDTPLYYLLLGGLAGIVGFRLGWRTRRPLLLPAVQGALGWVAFAASWRARGIVAATVAVGGWALGSTLASLVTFKQAGSRLDRRVLRARAYREEMVEWLRGGGALGGGARRMAAAQLCELGLHLAAALATANLLALVTGAALLNMMNAWVARLFEAAEERSRATAAALGWNVWSVVRVVAYVLLGSAATAPLAALADYPADPALVRWLFAAGLGGVLADVVLKIALSGAAGRRLAAAVDLDRLAAQPRAEGATAGAPRGAAAVAARWREP